MDLVVIHGNFTAAAYIEHILLQHGLVAAYGVGTSRDGTASSES
jgi:hypothetical protein